MSARIRSLGGRSVLTLGTFDLLHYGHLNVLNRAKKLGSLTVGVNSDRFASSYKARPFLDEDTRCKTIAALEFVDEVFLNDGPGAELIREVLPDYLVVGNDWLDNNYLEQIQIGRKELCLLGVSIVFVPRTPGVSTTKLRAHANR